MQDAHIHLPHRLSNPHPLIFSTREAATGLRVGPDRRLELRRKGAVRLAVSRHELPRALRLLQGVFAEAERRGWQVQPAERAYSEPEGVAIVVDDHSCEAGVAGVASM